MIELGHFAAFLALALAIVQAISGLRGQRQASSQIAVFAFVAMAVSFFTLILAFVNSDFSVALVAKNSNTLKPFLYKIAGTWGNHEGSMALWCLVTLGFGAAAAIWLKTDDDALAARALGIQGMIAVGSLAYLLFASSPYTRLAEPPLQGAGLNPLLQDPALAIHPPMLYLGYVGFSFVFALAGAGLLSGKIDRDWARATRPWALASFVPLTLGIGLGAYWAYYELGWGGWWFWDPVENASFMPWLIGTALIHSLAATEKRDVFKNWTILLSICAFALSLLGTFLVRSGVLTSVHAFATDPTRGTFILALLGFFVGGSLLLYAIRAPSTKSGSQFKLFSRETFLLFNSILLLVAMLTVLLGTIYPLIVEAFGKGKLSVGAPYFNAVFIPLMTPVAVLIGIGAIVRWKQDDISRIWHQLKYLLVASIVLGISIALVFYENNLLKTIFGLIASLWIVLTSIAAVYGRLANRQNKLVSLLNIPRSFYGMTLAHIGFALCIIGITITTQHSVDLHERMAPGDSVEFAGYKFTLDKIHVVPGPNYSATEAVVEAFKNGQYVTTLKTQKRIYAVRNMPMTEAGIDSGLMRDLYVSLGEPLDDTAWSLRLYHKPFVRWIWLGAIFMALGGILAATDRRYRLNTANKKLADIDKNTAAVK